MHLFAKQNANAGLIYYAWNTDSPDQTVPFCSIIMADAGVTALREWGQTAAFMDTTYGVNKYGYAFTALIVKDSHSNIGLSRTFSTRTKLLSSLPLSYKRLRSMLPRITSTYRSSFSRILAPQVNDTSMTRQ